jgi:hypothetical protein
MTIYASLEYAARNAQLWSAIVKPYAKDAQQCPSKPSAVQIIKISLAALLLAVRAKTKKSIDCLSKKQIRF